MLGNIAPDQDTWMRKRLSAERCNAAGALICVISQNLVGLFFFRLFKDLLSVYSL